MMPQAKRKFLALINFELQQRALNPQPACRSEAEIPFQQGCRELQMQPGRNLSEKMSRIRTIRRTYYNLFSHLYDAFVYFHSRRDDGDTRNFLVEMACLEGKPNSSVLDICCGTGAVVTAFAAQYTESFTVGYDFSRGMLLKVREKPGARKITLIEGDAAVLPFVDESFDVITCSHALYELKAAGRQAALKEMKRVVRQGGVILIMEHEVPQHLLVKILFNLRMLTMGSADAGEFVKGGLEPFQRIFSDVSLFHSPSGKSKLIVCRR
jgi:ubiquinone/menaquinone biosynthesis C-methylase UbiE